MALGRCYISLNKPYDALSHLYHAAVFFPKSYPNYKINLTIFD
jgi:hypothetical protein